MKIFISWSGDRSRAVADCLKYWIKCVIQASDPWISTRDIERGALWFTEISEKLNDVSIGIVCLTQENKNSPWILFEAGAMAKGLSSNRVCPILIDLESRDVGGPLAQFNHTFPTKDSMYELVATINRRLGDDALSEDVLNRVFLTYWEQFENEFNSAVEENQPLDAVEPRSENDILSEVLSISRGMQSRISNLETNLEIMRMRDPKDLNHKKYISEKVVFDDLDEYLKRELKKSKNYQNALAGFFPSDEGERE